MVPSQSMIAQIPWIFCRVCELRTDGGFTGSGRFLLPCPGLSFITTKKPWGPSGPFRGRTELGMVTRMGHEVGS